MEHSQRLSHWVGVGYKPMISEKYSPNRATYSLNLCESIRCLINCVELANQREQRFLEVKYIC